MPIGANTLSARQGLLRRSHLGIMTRSIHITVFALLLAGTRLAHLTYAREACDEKARYQKARSQQIHPDESDTG